MRLPARRGLRQLNPAASTAPHPRWPQVPACYGWLSLDRRGQWRLQGEPVSHIGLKEFIARHYGPDDAGCWLVENGPQRVFVALEYTPWIWHRQGDGSLRAHTGVEAAQPQAIFLDEEGSFLIQTPLGIGLVDDRDLPALAAECTDPAGHPLPDAAWEQRLAGEPVPIHWHQLPLQPLARRDVSRRFAFNPNPQA